MDDDGFTKICDSYDEAHRFAGSKSYAGYGEEISLTEEQVKAILSGKYVACTGGEYGAIIFLQYEMFAQTAENILKGAKVDESQHPQD